MVTPAAATKNVKQPVNSQTFVSVKANFNAYQKELCPDSPNISLSESESPTSILNFHITRSRSVSVKNLELSGLSGKMKYANGTVPTVIAPSIIKHHLQALKPRVPSICSMIPAEINPEKAPEISEPEYRMEFLRPSSFLVYQQDK